MESVFWLVRGILGSYSLVLWSYTLANVGTLLAISSAAHVNVDLLTFTNVDEFLLTKAIGL